jgi:hypothetical protein
VESVAFEPTPRKDLIAIVQSIPGSAGLTTRTIQVQDYGGPLEKTLENPFVWVGDGPVIPR